MCSEGTVKSIAWVTETFNLSSAASTDVSSRVKTSHKYTRHCAASRNPWPKISYK
jgi:hypothetical protein